MQTLSNELRAYYRSVADALPCAGHAKRRYLKELRNGLYDLQAEQPGADRKTACERFGTAEEIAEAWMEHISAHDFRQRVSFSRRTKRLVTRGMALVGIGLCLLGGFYVKHRAEVRGDVLVNYSITIYPQGTSRWDILCATAESMNITVEEVIEQEAEKKNVTLSECLQIIAAEDDMTLNEFVKGYDLNFEMKGWEKDCERSVK